MFKNAHFFTENINYKLFYYKKKINEIKFI